MRIIKAFCCILAAASFLAGCQKPESEESVLELSETALSFIDKSETRIVYVTANDSWKAESDAKWLNIQPASGQASDEAQKVEVTAEPNKGAIRTAVITFTSGNAASRKIEVEQAAVVYPGFSVSPTTLTPAATETSVTFNVTAEVDWKAVPSSGAKVEPASGNGNGTVTVTFPANEGVEAKAYTITVSTEAEVDVKFHTVTVNHLGAAPTIVLDKTSVDVSSSTTEASFTVTSNASWTISGSEGVVAEPADGSLNQTVRITFPKNEGADPVQRTATVSAEGATPVTFTVNQAGKESLTVSQSHFDVAADETSVTVDITANCPWIAKGFYAVPDKTSGTGNGQVTFTFEPNTSASENELISHIMTSDETIDCKITIVQAARECYIRATPESLEIGAEGGTVSFTAETTESWVSIIPSEGLSSDVKEIGSYSSPSATVTITVPENTEATVKTHTVRLKDHDNNAAEKTVTITQAAAEAVVTEAPKVGDYYYSDGTWSTALEPGKTPIAVVFYAGLASDKGDAVENYKMKDGVTAMPEVKAYAVAVRNVTDGATVKFALAWRDSWEDIEPGLSKDKTDFLGYKNQQAVIAFAETDKGGLSGSIDNYPAFWHTTVTFEAANPAPAQSSGWFIPSAGQMKHIWTTFYADDMYNSPLDAQFVAEGVGGEKMFQDYYKFWTSTFSGSDAGQACQISFDADAWSNQGYVDDYSYRSDAYYVRPVIVF